MEHSQDFPLWLEGKSVEKGREMPDRAHPSDKEISKRSGSARFKNWW
jgi:hypothetical protein